MRPGRPGPWVPVQLAADSGITAVQLDDPRQHATVELETVARRVAEEPVEIGVLDRDNAARRTRVSIRNQS
jgi:hypothetical protein